MMRTLNIAVPMMNPIKILAIKRKPITALLFARPILRRMMIIVLLRAVTAVLLRPFMAEVENAVVVVAWAVVQVADMALQVGAVDTVLQVGAAHKDEVLPLLRPQDLYLK